MKESYKNLDMSIIEFDSEDIITTSDGNDGTPPVPDLDI